MLIAHRFVSSVPPGGNPGDVTTSNWNDIHQAGASPTNYTASGAIPPTVDYIRATGGSGGIALVLTPTSTLIAGPTGQFQLNQVYMAKKIDSGAGAVVFTDSSGATFEGAASYSLTQQGQWAIFIWNGTSWDVFGGQSA